jgi:hypothetical protein
MPASGFSKGAVAECIFMHSATAPLAVEDKHLKNIMFPRAL